MDLREVFTTWHQWPGKPFRVSRDVVKVGCPCNRVPSAMWKLRNRITFGMEEQGHELHYSPRYNIGGDGIGISCRRCGLVVRGIITRVTDSYVVIDFDTPLIPACTKSHVGEPE
jgi:hypothetical protein